MKAGVLLRIVALGTFGAVLLVWAAVLSAADPAGDTPANGIPVSSTPSETCSSQTIAPGAQIWLKVPYHAGKDLEMHVKNAVGVSFDVYDPSQVANWPTLSPQPTGRLSPNANEPGYTKTWQGHLGPGNQSDFYYVLVTNNNAFPVTFSFCTLETDKFAPSGPGGSTASDTCLVTTSDTFSSDSPETITTTVIDTCRS